MIPNNQYISLSDINTLLSSVDELVNTARNQRLSQSIICQDEINRLILDCNNIEDILSHTLQTVRTIRTHFEPLNK